MRENDLRILNDRLIEIKQNTKAIKINELV